MVEFSHSKTASATKEDAKLLQRIAQKDMDAMRELHDRYAPRLRRFISGRVNDTFAANDVLQDLFVDVWRTAERFEFRSSVKTWLFTIANNKSMDLLRKSGRTTPLDEDYDPVDPDAVDPEAVVSMADDVEALRDCVDQLSEEHARCIKLAFYEGVSYADIAEIESVAEGTIKSRVHYAKQLLMRCLTTKNIKR